MPGLATAFNPLPGQRGGWTLGGFLVNTETGPAGRSPGSLHWAGIFNCYYWIDTDRDLAGVVLAQIMPFADAGVLDTFAALERWPARTPDSVSWLNARRRRSCGASSRRCAPHGPRRGDCARAR